MANYIVQKESLETVADSIRAKAGISEKLEFPLGWKAAVDGITDGGGGSFCALSVTSVSAVNAIVTAIPGVVAVTVESAPAPTE